MSNIKHVHQNFINSNIFSEVYLQDCVEGIKTYEDNYFDLAVVDPPYGICASKKKQYHKSAFTTYEPKDWDNARPLAEYFFELYRVSKYQIIWGANYFTEFLPEVLLKNEGVEPAKNWIVWDKAQPLGISFSMHELAYCNTKGQAHIFRVTNGSNGNRCTVKSKAKTRIHPTEKPVELYDLIFKHHAKSGYKILDTHLGSGNSRIAALKANLNFVGFEIDEDYFNASVKRFEMFASQGVLF